MSAVALGTAKLPACDPLATSYPRDSMPTVARRRAPRSPSLSSGWARRTADSMLAELDLADAELSVLLTDDAGIQRLNATHRGKDRPTDVLAFPMADGTTMAGPKLLGDVVISVDTAARQAASRRRPLEEEARFLLAHGLAHLLGHDHGTPDEKRRMDAVVRRLVRAASAAS